MEGTGPRCVAGAGEFVGPQPDTISSRSPEGALASF